MAYVAITKQLIVDVQRKIAGLKTAELDSLPNPHMTYSTVAADPIMAQLAMNHAWAPVADLRDRLEQYSTSGCITLAFKIPARSEASDGWITMESRVPQKQNIPCIVPVSGYYSSRDFTFEVATHMHELLPQVVEQFHARNEADKRWESVDEQVAKFLSSCKSLNEALKLWPDVARYVDKQLVAKANQKSEKAQKKESTALEALRAMDLDSINASTVLARMAGAQL